MNCYKIEAKATNSHANTIRIGERYIACERGCVFVVAKDAASACEQLGDAEIISVERVGLALTAAQ